MKEVSPVIPSKKAVNIFFAVYTVGSFLGLLGVLLLPKEEATLRKVAFGMSYFFGLPIALSAALMLLRKLGIWNGK